MYGLGCTLWTLVLAVVVFAILIHRHHVIEENQCHARKLEVYRVQSQGYFRQFQCHLYVLFSTWSSLQNNFSMPVPHLSLDCLYSPATPTTQLPLYFRDLWANRQMRMELVAWQQYFQEIDSFSNVVAVVVLITAGTIIMISSWVVKEELWTKKMIPPDLRGVWEREEVYSFEEKLLLEDDTSNHEFIQLMRTTRKFPELRLKGWTEDPTLVLCQGESSSVYPLTSKHFPDHPPLCIKVLQQTEVIGTRTDSRLSELIQEAQNL